VLEHWEEYKPAMWDHGDQWGPLLHVNKYMYMDKLTKGGHNKLWGTALESNIADTSWNVHVWVIVGPYNMVTDMLNDGWRYHAYSYDNHGSSHSLFLWFNGVNHYNGIGLGVADHERLRQMFA
jgi:hypothetical protein